jgi:ABC-type phosphate transport system substrate-binding protein
MNLCTFPNLRAACLITAFGLSLSAQAVVIVSTKNSISLVTSDQLAQIFLGQVSTFYTGAKAEPLDQPASSPLRQDFYQKYLGKSQAQIKAHWSKQAFSGKGQPPRELGSSPEIVKLVAENPKYIAYVDPGAVDGTVKVLKIK